MFCPKSSGLGALLRQIILSVFLIIVASSANTQVLFNSLEDSTYATHWIGLQTIDSGFAHSGMHFSAIDSAHPFGIGLESLFPEVSRGKNVKLKISGWVKSEVAFDEAVFVLSLKEKDENLLWKGINLGPLVLENNQWFYFSDSLNIPASVSAAATIKAYLWNSDSKNRMGMDDLKFEFSAVENLSFFPDVDASIQNNYAPGNPIFGNSFYKVYYNRNTEEIKVLSRDGEPIIDNVGYYEEQKQKSKKIKKQLPLQFKKVNELEDGSDLIFKVKASSIQITLQCKKDSPEIQFQIKSKYKRNQEFIRQSLVLKAGQEVTEVYRKNRKSDLGNFQDEYWLDKEGVKFGTSKNSLIVYHTPHISSLQLKPADSLLIVNLDYEKDHPFLHFPLDNDTIDLKVDWSSSKYQKSSKRQFAFSIFIGTKARNLPRLMKNPNGFLATYIWTEHADWTDIRTNRAAFFGSEKISNSTDATGGFVFYNIRVTKSVFWDNPDKISNAEVSGGKFNSQESTIMADTAFHDFLSQLHLLGHEICLHTPEQFTTTPESLETALDFMQKTFNSPTWIDHGYNNKIQNNREDLVCDGSNRKSKHYSIDLWKKYGIKYLWNPYHEDYFSFKGMHFSDKLEKPYSGYGDFYPNPDYWQHPSRTNSLYHWPTSSVLFVTSIGLWDYFFNEQVLKSFVDDWAVEMNHCYPAWVDPAKGFWIWDNDSTIVAAPGFNKSLQRMAALRDDGILNLTTIQDFLDYRLAVEQISYEILANGGVQISNHSSKEIQGLSFASRSSFLLVDGLKPSQKIVGEDVVFWFDLGVGESKTIRVFE